MQAFREDEKVLIRCCHLLQRIGGHSCASQLDTALLQSLFTSIFASQLVISNDFIKLMVFRTYER